MNAYLDSRGQTTKNQVRNLELILETDFSFSIHVKAVTKSAYYHLKNIARIRCFVSSQDLEKLVHAFITSRVDYCNGLLTGLPKKTIRQLQLIQNAAARILTRTRKSEHITPVLRSLHWLPVTFRIDFKVLLLVYKSLNGIGPKYMADILTEYKPNRPLRSLGSSQLEIPRVHTKQGESAFSHYTIQIKLGWALFVTYTIIQSIMRSEMCSLHLTHPSVHTWSSGQPTVQRPGSSRGLPVGAGIFLPPAAGTSFQKRSNVLKH